MSHPAVHMMPENAGLSQEKERLRLAMLIFLHIVACCATLVLVAKYDSMLGVTLEAPDPGTYTFYPPAFHVFFYPAQFSNAVIAVAATAAVASFFVIGCFSFGYFAGFYFYTMILGYLWINSFSDFNYDHRLAGFSAVASIVAFLIPALFVSSPLRQKFMLSAEAFDRLLMGILLLGIATIAIGAYYNFRIVAVRRIYDFRDQLVAPTFVNYLVAVVSNALLPFVFAASIARRAYWQAAAALLLLPLFYPIVLSKVAFFTPAWLIAVLLLSRIFEARIAVILSLLVPMLVGLASLLSLKLQAAPIFYMINFRLITIPSVAMDVYNDFFSRNDLTYFCQVSLLKQFMSCPYHEPLAVLLEREYVMGNFNASSFATEGIASVGPLLAPVSAFAVGLVIALGNRASAGLPAGFILVSGAIFPQIMVNVPLSTVLLTHGGAIIFLLWYLTPRGIFEQDGRANAVAN
jgi:hypothetical protein